MAKPSRSQYRILSRSLRLLANRFLQYVRFSSVISPRCRTSSPQRKGGSPDAYTILQAQARPDGQRAHRSSAGVIEQVKGIGSFVVVDGTGVWRADRSIEKH